MNDPKAAAAYHPGDSHVTRPDLDALPLDISPAITIRAEYENTVLARELLDMQTALAAERARADQAAEESDDWEVKHAQQRRARLAAERICRQLISDGLYWKERADQAEQRIADAPHEPTCFIYSHRGVARYCNCWKSAAPTTEQ